jgi:hypothetical protein
MAKEKKVQTFPVMDGGGPAPRADQIAGIVAKVWGDARLYHADVEPMLRQWLSIEGCVITDAEFEMLLAKARGEFVRAAIATASDEPAHCPATTLVDCLFWDVQRLEHRPD